MIYLTGSSGFIGKHILEYLTLNNESVICHKRGGNFDSIVMCDTVINCQAYGNHYNQTDIQETIKANCSDLSEMLTYCREKRVYNISSSSVRLNIQTPYSLTKQLGELIVNAYENPKFTNVRPYSVFGEGEANNRFIPTVIRCLNSGETMYLVTEPRHDWIYVDSFIDLMFKGVVECGSGLSYSNLEIVEMLEEISGKKLNYNKVESMRIYDNEDWICQIKNELKVELLEGLKKMYENF